MALVTSHTEPLVLTNGLPSTAASPGSYFGFGLNATKSASSGTRIYTGSGSPNGVLTAPLGSLWMDNTSTAGAYYVNVDGATSWITFATSTQIPFLVADPGSGVAIPVTKSATINFTIGGGAETNTLAIPVFVGQELILNADTVGAGTRTVTSAQAVNIAGNTVLLFNAVRDSILLVAVTVAGVNRWQVGWNNSVGLS